MQLSSQFDKYLKKSWSILLVDSELIAIEALNCLSCRTLKTKRYSYSYSQIGSETQQ